VIFHIVGRGEWDQAVSKGRYEPASVKIEGFMHCSTLAQLIETGNRLYRGRSDLVVLCIDEERIEFPVRREAPAQGSAQRFPHVYGPLGLEAITKVVDFPCEGDGSFRMPAALNEA
jgi:uncharacterized protein (DUF952 family)